MQKGLRNLSTMFCVFSVHHQPEEILYIQLRSLCVRARTTAWAGNALDVLVALKFGLFFIYVDFLKAFCHIEAIKSCLLPFLSN